MSVQGQRKGHFEERELGPTGRVVRECETFTCNHCTRVIRVWYGMELGQEGVGEFCLCCMQPICCPCNAEMNKTGKCVPFQKKLEQAYARQHLLKSIGP